MTESNAQLPATINKQPARQRLWPLWILAALALIATIILGLWSWQQWTNTQAAQQSMRQSMQESINSLEQETSKLERLYGNAGNQSSQRLQALENRLDSQRELIATQQRQIDHNARELLEAGHRTRTDWLLAEAEYLLRVANQRLMIEKDIQGALAALRSADEVLNDSDDVGVYPVRQQLAKEIIALRGLSSVDRTGLYLTLEAAIESISELTDNVLANDRLMSSVTPSQIDAVSGSPLSSEWWFEAWDRAKSTLSQVIVVRRLDEPVKPMLSPEQSAYARLNLQLMLEQAELAVLQGRQELYSRSLTKARNAIDTWYDSNHPKIIALSDTLAEIADHDIDPDLPDISKSLELLKARLAGRPGSGQNTENDQPDSSDKSDTTAEGEDA